MGNPPSHRGGWDFLLTQADHRRGAGGYGECDMAHGREHAVALPVEGSGEARVVGVSSFETWRLWDVLYASTGFYRPISGFVKMWLMKP